MLAKEVSLAKTLGVKSLEVNSRRLPDTNTVKRLEKQVEELTRLSEEREQKMFAIKEGVIHLLDVLDLDLNATSIEEMLIVNQDQFDALQSKDVESAQQTLNNLREKVEVKKNEVVHCLSLLSYLMHLICISEVYIVGASKTACFKSAKLSFVSLLPRWQVCSTK